MILFSSNILKSEGTDVKIKRLQLKNIRSLNKVDVDFENQNWALILGDNGQGKSTILKAIAIGLCDLASASALVMEMSGQFVTKDDNVENDGNIVLDIEIPRKGEFRITTFFKLSKYTESINKNYEYKNKQGDWIEWTEEFPWESLFVVGYGAGRTITADQSYEDYAAVDAVYTLFRNNWPLQNPELSIRRLDRESKAGRKGVDFEKEMEPILKTILPLGEKGRIKLKRNGVFIKSFWGETSIGEVSDGYRTMLTLIVDMLSWRMLTKKSLTPEKISGVVLIDEIEQHLHPKWQKEIIPSLRNKFKNIQFISTTHSPLCVVGATSTKDNCLLIHVDNNSEESVVSSLSPRGMNATRLFQSEYFERTSLQNDDMIALKESYKKLILKDKPTKNDLVEMSRLRRLLKMTSDSSWSSLEDVLIRESLETKYKNLMKRSWPK